VNTPKAFANFSPGLERSNNPGDEFPKCALTLKGFANRRTLSGFNDYFDVLIPRVVAALEPWAGISERLRRIHAISN